MVIIKYYEWTYKKDDKNYYATREMANEYLNATGKHTTNI